MKQCEAADAELDPFACIEQVVCVHSEEQCVDLFKPAGAECWTGKGGSDSLCVGHACVAGECKVDIQYNRECGEEDFPEECDDSCTVCTALVCHWIPDPANPDDAKKMIPYCQPKALVGDACNDYNGCTVGDVCTFLAQTDGPLGKETLGACGPGEGKSKEECLEELGKPALPCILAGVSCSLEEGCHLDQDKADQWCWPPSWPPVPGTP